MVNVSREGAQRNMTDDELLKRIKVDPGVMAGKPVVRGTRLTVEHILNLLANGETPTGILDEYPGITDDDIRACLVYAARR
jgi:uncharacterized protein (DUF433 family)